MRIESINAVTLACRSMRRSVAFYRGLGFVVRYGGEEASFTSFVVGPNHLNLQLVAASGPAPAWGRVIVYVTDVDAMYERARALGHVPLAAPRDAPWGERFFHLRDPDGHELSFARPLAETGGA